MAIVNLSVVPLGTGTPSLSEYVARAVALLEHQDVVSYQLTPMGTVLEGDLGEILDLVKQMHESVFDSEVSRVLTTIAIDDRRDKTATMDAKVSSVKKRLQG